MSRLIEEWRPIRGFEGFYNASDWGRVKSLARMRKAKGGSLVRVPEKILTPVPDDKGYLKVNLFKNGKATSARVHILVWDTFVGEDRTGLEVNHMDENTKNNAVWNLNLLNHKDNLNWGTRNERAAKSLSKPVFALDADKNMVYIFSSAHEAGENGFNSGNITACCKGHYLRDGNHTYKGLDWYYRD